MNKTNNIDNIATLRMNCLKATEWSRTKSALMSFVRKSKHRAIHSDLHSLASCTALDGPQILRAGGRGGEGHGSHCGVLRSLLREARVLSDGKVVVFFFSLHF